MFCLSVDEQHPPPPPLEVRTPFFFACPYIGGTWGGDKREIGIYLYMYCFSWVWEWLCPPPPPPLFLLFITDVVHVGKRYPYFFMLGNRLFHVWRSIAACTQHPQSRNRSQGPGMHVSSDYIRWSSLLM